MKPRRRKCKAASCRQWIERPWSTLQQACSPPCAQEIAEAKRTKEEARRAAAERKAQREERRRHRERKEALKTRRQWMKEAQQAFNAYIRLRDEGRECISCGTINPEWTRGGQWDCGHYRSVGACPELRFCEINAHRQCKKCNSYKSGNVVEYRLRLVARIGQESVDWLEGPHGEKKYTIDELRAIRDDYRQRVKTA